MNDRFKPWPKIPRLKGKMPHVVITEKLDGTNACVIVEDGHVVSAQSRKRIITPDDDNYGFAQWVEDNKESLSTLGNGYHYGEWYGHGVQKNPANLDDKYFFLFDADKWTESRPDCCRVVETLYRGAVYDGLYKKIMNDLSFHKPWAEGIIIYTYNTMSLEKLTFKNVHGKWVDNS